jgi:hypothetical protein
MRRDPRLRPRLPTYDQVGHSFFSQVDGWQGWLARVPTPMAVGYDEAAAHDGWERVLSFFDEHARRNPLNLLARLLTCGLRYRGGQWAVAGTTR